MHSAYVDDKAVAGVGYVLQARCVCGWLGTLGADQRQADIEKAQHNLAFWEPSHDDIAWLTGTGRFSQD